MPGTKKKECCKCKNNKWPEDFKEGRFLPITPMSVCLTCEQAEIIQAQEKEIDMLKKKGQERDNRLKILEEKLFNIEKAILQEGEEQSKRGTNRNEMPMKESVKELRKIVKENIEEIVETGRQVVEIREQMSSLQDTGRFQKAKGTKAKRTVRNEHAIPLTNRFEILEDETDKAEIETYVIGDSIVREQTNYFAAKNKQRKIQSYPGCRAEKVTDEIKALKVKSRKTCIIANAGNNNLFLRGNEVGKTEPLMTDLGSLVDSLLAKTDGGLVIGLMPRMYASYFAMSKAIGINERIGRYCRDMKVEFYDVWNDFVGKWQYFKSDGIHLNEAGHIKLQDILEREYERVKKRLYKQPSPEQSQVSPTPIQGTSREHKQGN